MRRNKLKSSDNLNFVFDSTFAVTQELQNPKTNTMATFFESTFKVRSGLDPGGLVLHYLGE